MKVSAVVLAVLLAVLPQISAAQDEAVYVRFSGGPSWFETEIDDVGPIDLSSEGERGFFVGGAIGYDGGFWRLEGYGAYDDVSDGKIGIDQISGIDFGLNVKSLSTGVNGFLEAAIPGAPMLEGYVGAGVGYSYIETEVDVAGVQLINDDDNALSYQAMAGTRFMVSDEVELGLGYRFWTIPDYDVQIQGLNDGDGEILSHSIEASLAYRFSL